MRKIKKNSAKSGNKNRLLAALKFILLIFIFPFKHKIISAFAVIAVLALIAWNSRMHDVISEEITTKIDAVSRVFGLEIKDIYLEGRIHASATEIERAISVSKGQSILRVSLNQTRSRIEQVPWVKTAVVERLLPSTISIHIIEREPIAIWQNEGRLHIIDRDGNVIEERNFRSFSNLIILVGKDVPAYASNLLSIIESEPTLRSKVSSAIRVGERRWNIRLQNEIEIRLPEEDQEKAWHFLANMHAESKLLDAPIKLVDLRVPDKVYIKKK